MLRKVTKHAKRIGTQAVKVLFQVDLQDIKNLECLGDSIKSGAILSVCFERGGKISCTSDREFEGDSNFEVNQTVSLVATLYRNKNGTFQEKFAKLILRQLKHSRLGGEAYKGLAFVQVALHDIIHELMQTGLKQYAFPLNCGFSKEKGVVVMNACVAARIISTGADDEASLMSDVSDLSSIMGAIFDEGAFGDSRARKMSRDEREVVSRGSSAKLSSLTFNVAAVADVDQPEISESRSSDAPDIFDDNDDVTLEGTTFHNEGVQVEDVELIALVDGKVVCMPSKDEVTELTHVASPGSGENVSSSEGHVCLDSNPASARTDMIDARQHGRDFIEGALQKKEMLDKGNTLTCDEAQAPVIRHTEKRRDIATQTVAMAKDIPETDGYICAEELYSAELIAQAKKAGIKVPYRPRRNTEMIELRTRCDLLNRQLRERDQMVQELQADMQVQVESFKAQLQSLRTNLIATETALKREKAINASLEATKVKGNNDDDNDNYLAATLAAALAAAREEAAVVEADHAASRATLRAMEEELAATRAAIRRALQAKEEEKRAAIEASAVATAASMRRAELSQEVDELLSDLIQSKLLCAEMCTHVDEEQKKYFVMRHRMQKYAQKLAELEVSVLSGKADKIGRHEVVSALSDNENGHGHGHGHAYKVTTGQLDEMLYDPGDEHTRSQPMAVAVGDIAEIVSPRGHPVQSECGAEIASKYRVTTSQLDDILGEDSVSTLSSRGMSGSIDEVCDMMKKLRDNEVMVEREKLQARRGKLAGGETQRGQGSQQGRVPPRSALPVPPKELVTHVDIAEKTANKYRVTADEIDVMLS